MLNEVLQTIRGVAIYPVLGLVIFVSAFVVMIVATWRMKKSDVEHASRLPLDDASADSTTGHDSPGGNKEGNV